MWLLSVAAAAHRSRNGSSIYGGTAVYLMMMMHAV